MQSLPHSHWISFASASDLQQIHDYSVLNIASFCLQHSCNPLRHTSNQLLALGSWYSLPFLLHPLCHICVLTEEGVVCRLVLTNGSGNTQGSARTRMMQSLGTQGLYKAGQGCGSTRTQRDPTTREGQRRIAVLLIRLNLNTPYCDGLGLSARHVIIRSGNKEVERRERRVWRTWPNEG